MGYAKNKQDEERDKRRNKRSTPTQRTEWSFVNISLTQADKQALGKWIDGEVDLLALVYETIENGYKISVTFEERSDGYLCSLAGKTCVEENRGRILTGRGSSPENAIASCLYRHYNLSYDGIWPSDTTVDGDFA